MSEQAALLIKIDNKKPIELIQLTLSLSALASQYDSFLRKSETFECDKSQRKLYISKLESGSLVAELLASTLSVTNQLNPILEFASYLKTAFDYCLGTEKEQPAGLTKTDYAELSQILEPIANDNQSNITIQASGNHNNIIVLNIDSTKANAIQNILKKHLDKEQDEPSVYYKVLMYWANAGFRQNKINDKIIIEKIDKKPKRVIFENDQDKRTATSHNPGFSSKNWQDLAYIVDVEVLCIQGVPKEYKIIRVYGDETFDPEEQQQI